MAGDGAKHRLEFPVACYHVINRGNYRALGRVSQYVGRSRIADWEAEPLYRRAMSIVNT